MGDVRALEPVHLPKPVVEVCRWTWRLVLACVAIGAVSAPTLFAGSAAGALAAHGLAPGATVLWAIAGMSCLMAAVTHAPLMAAFLAAELTATGPCCRSCCRWISSAGGLPADSPREPCMLSPRRRLRTRVACPRPRARRYSEQGGGQAEAMRDGVDETGTERKLPQVHGLLAPLDTLSRRSQWMLLLLCTALVLGWSAFHNGDLLVAWGLPDVKYYKDMARGRFDLVPQPFSARPLAPLLARWIARAAGCWIEGGFTVLAYLSLLWSVLVVFWLLLRSSAPRWLLPAMVAVPFWPQLLGFAGLPDPLYTALLATLLLALEREWMRLAAVLLLPLMLARESTTLTLLCLLLAGTRRLRWTGSALAIGCAGLGMLVVRHVSAGGLPNPEGLSGGGYLIGKMVSNSLRSLGVVPWSNVYPELCSIPTWQMGLRFGTVRSVGVCSWTPISPLQAVWALLTSFGVLPVVLLALWRSWRPAFRDGGLLVRFCLLYGGISFAIAPTLGTWYARLFGYGWPLLLVALPRLLSQPSQAGARAWMEGAGDVHLWTALLLVHLLVCSLGNLRGTGVEEGCVMALQGAAIALLVVHQRRLPRARFSA